jgi:hypothetical protein
MILNERGNCDEISRRLFGCQGLARKGVFVVCGMFTRQVGWGTGAGYGHGYRKEGVVHGVMAKRV